jgi:hypothetical protein
VLFRSTGSSVSAPFTAYEATAVNNKTPLNSRVLGTGTIGWYRAYNGAYPPVEQSQYVYVVMDNNWNITGLTGNKYINLTYNRTLLGNPQAYSYTTTAIPSGFAAFTVGIATAYSAGTGSGGIKYTTYNKDATAYARYTASKPSGLGISGTVYKDNGGSTKYSSRVFISDVNKKTITSELLTNVNDYNFTTNASQIYVSILTPVDTFYNSSLLFTSSALPTPTATPIPTPTGVGYGDDTTGTIYIRDGLNQTLLANAYLELHYTNSFGDMSVAGYTDSVGKIVFAGLDNGQYYNAMIWKTGYAGGQYNFQATPVSFIKTFYIYPATTPTETIPTQINVSVRVMDKTTYAPVSGAYVMCQNTLTGASTTTLTTNATGYATFMGFPNSANIGGTIVKTGYVYQNWNIPYQSSTGSYMPDADVIYTVQIQPTSAVTPTGTIIIPTPTPVTIDKLILTATPDSINLGASVSLTGSSSNATRLTYAGGLRRTSFYVNVHPQTYPVDYNMIGIFENVNATYWKFRANNSATWNTATTASPLTMTNIPNANGLITYAFNAYDTNGAISTAGTDDVLVGGGAGGGALTIKIGAYDASTNAQLLNFNLNVTDESNGAVTEFGNVSYDKEITLPRGNGYVARATKTGYQTSTVIGETGTLLFVVPTSPNIQKGDFGAYFRIPMFPDGSVIAGNTSISARVYDLETYYPLSGVQVVNSYAPTDIKYTGTDAESVSWVIPHNTAYTLTASKNGYCTVTESKNTGTNSNQWIPIYIKYGTCTGATATPTPTPTITPTATPIGGWGNVTGGASVCGDMPANATIIDILKNSMACNGLEDTQSQNLGMSMLIILFAAIILGRIAKGVGVLAGAIIGTVISTVAGFLPFWIIIVVIIMAGLVFAGKVFWSNSQ